MQICSHCNVQQLDGTIFCSECGASLFQPEQHANTAALPPEEMGDATPYAVEANVIAAPVAGPPGRSLRLVVLNSGRRIELDPGDDLLIGRKDNARGIFPDVDLGLEGGYDAGVSRRHAIIALQRDGWLLEDLASANGTFINGQRIPPRQPVPINNGDELRFGTLLLRFECGTG